MQLTVDNTYLGNVISDVTNVRRGQIREIIEVCICV